MAEGLVCAQASHLEGFPPNVRNKWPQYKKDQYAARIRVGDFVTIQPDGWEWGGMERLPRFVVIKAPEISYAQAKQYEQSIKGTPDNEGNAKTTRHRRFAVPESFVQNMIDLNQSEVTVALADFNSNLLDHL